MSVGFYIISGWMKEKDAAGFNRKEPDINHRGLHRGTIRTFFSKYCHECDNPSLLRVEYFYADNDIRDCSWELAPRKFKKHFTDPSKI